MKSDFLFLFLLGLPFLSMAQNKPLQSKIQKTPNLVVLWTFTNTDSQVYESTGSSSFPLKPFGNQVQLIPEGPISGYSVGLDGTNYLKLTHSETGKLNIHGPGKEVTVLAWIKWSGQGTGFVAGMWNEYQDGGKRQYGLFVNLPHYNGRNQVCGHISFTGKPTPPFPYSIDYSASGQEVPANEWVCVAMTYDGSYIRSYVNGEFEARKPELIDHTRGFPGYPEGLTQVKNPYLFEEGLGNNGSDFTVGAVLLKNGMGNFFRGQIGGLAIFDRALNDSEIQILSDL